MRFDFSFAVSGVEERPTSLHEVEWIPLHRHPVFAGASAVGGDVTPSAFRVRRNLLAWDGATRLFFWDSNRMCLHRITIRLGDPNPTSVMSASSSKVLETDVHLNSVINEISVNRNGSSLFLVAPAVVHVMYLYGRTSAKDNTKICRTVPVGSSIYSDSFNAIHILKVSWHPCSDTHLGILSSDSVLRIFDTSSDIEQPEQEYYLQPVERGRHRNASSLRPVDFSFGDDHMWERFSAFVLFSDGSVYLLCPVVPFGSVYRWEHLLEIYSDAENSGIKSANSTAVSNASMAVSWLESTFPELTEGKTERKNLPVLKSHPFALLDASLLLQGPLHKVSHEGGAGGTECEGSAVSFLYSTIRKDSILVTCWSSGQLQIDALGDEIQPAWTLCSPPCLRVDSHDKIRSIAMICESNPSGPAIIKPHQHPDQTAWLGHTPPLLRLAIVDLALKVNSVISAYVDPLIPERIYAVHDGGLDSIVLHFLPFTSQVGRKDDATKKTPTVNPVLSTFQGDFSSLSPLLGFVPLSDLFGYSWIVGVASSGECTVLEMKTWNALLPVHIETERKLMSSEEPVDRGLPRVISKELLSGPEIAIIPSVSMITGSISGDSIEGRSALHQYFSLFHEIYVEYAHKVHFELKYHESHLKRIIDEQHRRLCDSQQKILKVEEKQVLLQHRLDRAIQQHSLLDERLQSLRKLPGAHRKPLSRTELEFKSQLDWFTGVELGALHASIDAMCVRVRRCMQFQVSSVPNRPRHVPPARMMLSHGQEDMISQLQSSISKLSLVNGENSKKVKVVESELRRREGSC